MVKVQRGRGTMDLTFSLKSKADMRKLNRMIEEGSKPDSPGIMDAATKAGIIKAAARFEIVPDGPRGFVLIDNESLDATAPVYETMEKASAAMRAASR